ncbi:MAG: phosphotransferase family protein [Acidimicrobiia bacterium]
MTDELPGLDLPVLESWISEHHPDLAAHWSAALITGGRSNLTYELRSDQDHLVFRRPPLGHVLETAHDMNRETTVMRALRTFVPVPEVVDSVDAARSPFGVPFSLTRFVDGTVLRTPEDLAQISPAEARARSEQLIDTLAELHMLNISDVGLDGFGKPEGFLERNVARWCAQWEQNKTRSVPTLDALGIALSARVPRSPRPSVLHGDFRLDNTILSPTGIAAIVDWEMSTLGDPLTDFALMCCYWSLPEDVVVAGVAHISPTHGFMTQGELLDRYSTATGLDLEHFPYYQSYAIFKLAVILEGINARFKAGQTVGAGFDSMSAAVDRLAEWGHDAQRALPNA